MMGSEDVEIDLDCTVGELIALLYRLCFVQYTYMGGRGTMWRALRSLP